jgi:hypothetical protein
VQQQQRKITTQTNLNAVQADQIAAQAAQLRDVQQQLTEMHAALLKVQAKEEFVAQR